MTRPPIAPALLAWAAQHGRRDLPWQRDPTPYRVWISEVMLQQTQVATVTGYYERFLAAFPDLRALARAPLDAVLAHWSGLGYYARARNLHRAACLALERHAGELPQDFAQLAALPGIGRSTAGAILALSCDLPYPILDGNARRVLSRYHGVDTPRGVAATEKRLWEYAQRETPPGHAARYTQAIMDLGATLCGLRRPRCGECPLHADCAACIGGDPETYPPRRTAAPRIPERSTCMLIVRDARGAVWLERRPEQGLWGGLWTLPEVTTPDAVTGWCLATFGCVPEKQNTLAPFTHVFSHFRLAIQPLVVTLGDVTGVRDGEGRRWMDPGGPAPGGLAAPVRRLIDGLVDRFP